MPIFLGMVWSEIASNCKSLISKGKMRTITKKKRWINNKIASYEKLFVASKTGIITENAAQTNATMIIFKYPILRRFFSNPLKKGTAYNMVKIVNGEANKIVFMGSEKA